MVMVAPPYDQASSTYKDMKLSPQSLNFFQPTMASMPQSDHRDECENIQSKEMAVADYTEPTDLQNNHRLIQSTTKNRNRMKSRNNIDIDAMSARSNLIKQMIEEKRLLSQEDIEILSTHGTRAFYGFGDEQEEHANTVIDKESCSLINLYVQKRLKRVDQAVRSNVYERPLCIEESPDEETEFCLTEMRESPILKENGESEFRKQKMEPEFHLRKVEAEFRLQTDPITTNFQTEAPVTTNLQTEAPVITNLHTEMNQALETVERSPPNELVPQHNPHLTRHNTLQPYQEELDQQQRLSILSSDNNESTIIGRKRSRKYIKKVRKTFKEQYEEIKEKLRG